LALPSSDKAWCTAMANGDGVLPSPGAETKQGQSKDRALPAKIDLRGPFSALVVVGIFVAATLMSSPTRPGAALPWTLNPTGYLYGWRFVSLYVITIPAKEVMNKLLNVAATSLFGFRKMDEGSSPVRKLEVLENIDLCYLAFNTMVEFLGMSHVAAFLISGPLEQRLRSFELFNGPVAFVLVMCLNDIIYYPFHLVAHKRAFYPYCHKQHHRQFVPFRGYADAANQHPFEQIYGFFIFVASMYLTSRIVGLHIATALCASLAWAVLNVANHLAFDSNMHLPLPYPAFPRDHQMHHRFPQCNYSTLTTFCDRACGTFKSYKELGEPIVANGTEDTKREQCAASVPSRTKAIPSPYSVVVVGLALCLAAVALEAYHSGRLPQLEELLPLLRPGAATAAVTGLCATLGEALTTQRPRLPKRD